MSTPFVPSVVTAGDGVSLHVEVSGPQGRGGDRVGGSAVGPVTVVLAHGWTLDARCWAPVAESIAAGLRAPRVVRYDHRGHGRSAPAAPETMTLEHLADDLADVIEATAPIGPLVLGGHSMGGMTIMALAERHPDLVARVAGVALVATACGGLAGHTLGLPPRRAALVRRIEQRMYSTRHWSRRPTIGSPRLLAPAVRWLVFGPHPDCVAVRIACESIASCRPVTVSGFRPSLEAHERDAALAAFASVPTVVLVGSCDRLTPVASARRIAVALPSATLTIYPDAGHMLPIERVDAVSAQLSALVGLATKPKINRA